MRQCRKAGADSERGSVLLLGIGLLGCCLLAIAVVVDAGDLLRQRQALLAVADGASLAGAQAIDLDEYYRNGATSATRLDPPAVRAAVLGYVRAHVGRGDVQVESVATDGSSAVVEVSAPMSAPFLGPLLGERIRVRSAARLDYAAE